MSEMDIQPLDGNRGICSKSVNCVQTINIYLQTCCLTQYFLWLGGIIHQMTDCSFQKLLKTFRYPVGVWIPSLSTTAIINLNLISLTTLKWQICMINSSIWALITWGILTWMRRDSHIPSSQRGPSRFIEMYSFASVKPAWCRFPWWHVTWRVKRCGGLWCRCEQDTKHYSPCDGCTHQASYKVFTKHVLLERSVINTRRRWQGS